MTIRGYAPGVISRLPGRGSPPPVNGGVIGLMADLGHGLGGPPRFDKYEATVFQPNDDVLHRLTDAWPRNTCWSEKPFLAGGYQAIRVGERWEPEVGIKYGGNQPHPWVGSYAGICAPALAGIVREWAHKVTTVDVKFDVQGEGVFEHCVGVADSIRRRQRICPEMIGYGDLDGIKGRTVYFGSKQSGFRLTIYEKSKQLRTVKGLIVPDNIVRVEGRFKPQTKEAGLAMSKLSPEEYWSTCRWGRVVFNELIGAAIPAISLPRNEGLADDAAMVSMLAQYLRVVRTVKNREGGWEQFGRYLEFLEAEAEMLAADRAAKIRTRNDAARS